MCVYIYIKHIKKQYNVCLYGMNGEYFYRWISITCNIFSVQKKKIESLFIFIDGNCMFANRVIIRV